MDEKVERTDPGGGAEPDIGGNGAGPVAWASADRLIARVGELRAQLEILAPQGEDERREARDAVEHLRRAQERIRTLELLLAQARKREDGLTGQAVRDLATIAELEARNKQLIVLENEAAASDDARRNADARVSDAERRATLVENELRARLGDLQRLRARCVELEAQVGRLSGHAEEAIAAREQTKRLERERDEARGRAFTERRLAAQDRMRAAEAEQRAAAMEGGLQRAEQRLAELMEGLAAPSPLYPEDPEEDLEAEEPPTTLVVVEEPTDAEEEEAAEEPAEVEATVEAAEGSEVTIDELLNGEEVIDLTDEPASAEEPVVTEPTTDTDVPPLVVEIRKSLVGALGGLFRGRRHEEVKASDPAETSNEPPAAIG